MYDSVVSWVGGLILLANLFLLLLLISNKFCALSLQHWSGEEVGEVESSAVNIYCILQVTDI